MLVCSGVEVLTKKLFSFSTSPSQCTRFWLLYRHSTWVWLWDKWYQGKLGNQEQCPQFSKTHLSSIDLYLTISLPFLVFTWKRPIKVQKLQIPLKSLFFFFFFFTLACERTYIKNTVLKTDLLCTGQTKHAACRHVYKICCLQACVHTFQPGNITAGAVKGLTADSDNETEAYTRNVFLWFIWRRGDGVEGGAVV